MAESDDDDPQMFCKRRNAHCYDDLCQDYGCAIDAGMEPDRDETYTQGSYKRYRSIPPTNVKGE